jgi:hypothetical protein
MAKTAVRAAEDPSAHWARRIEAAHKKTAQAVIKTATLTGRELIAAKAALKPGQFAAMVKTCRLACDKLNGTWQLRATRF